MIILQEILSFFNHPFFIVVGGVTTLIAIICTCYTFFLIAKGILPVWYRLGLGLSKRKIAVFAEQEYNSLKSILVDSKIFEEKNIMQIDRESIKKGELISLLLVHWKCFDSELDKILEIKKDSDALIIYAPQNEGYIDKESLLKINSQRNSIIVNFRGRLLNDILTSMVTTCYSKGA